MKTNIIHIGDALDILQKIDSDSVDCIVTSPPYFNQRDYSVKGQIGTESNISDYINALVRIFNEAKRVLKSTGTLWLNLGDKYSNKGLISAPWRVAIALQDNGWILRNDIIWHKPNAMPSSTKSRLTTDHEYIFFFVKNKDHYFNQNAIREPHITFSENSKMKGGRNHFGKKNATPEAGKNKGNSNLHDSRWDQAFHPLGRNKRTVWNIPLSKFRGSHFAVFPEKLAENCILAGCPENGIILDPFFGSGTTGVVAKNNSRNYIGIELNPEYVMIAKNRLDNCSETR